MTKCPTCATELPAESRFCLSCGTALDDSYPATLIQADGQAPAVNRPARQTRTATPDSPRYLSTDDSLDQTTFVPGPQLAGRCRIRCLLRRAGLGEAYRADALELAHSVPIK